MALLFSKSLHVMFSVAIVVTCHAQTSTAYYSSTYYYSSTEYTDFTDTSSTYPTTSEFSTTTFVRSSPEESTPVTIATTEETTTGDTTTQTATTEEPTTARETTSPELTTSFASTRELTTPQTTTTTTTEEPTTPEGTTPQTKTTEETTTTAGVTPPPSLTIDTRTVEKTTAPDSTTTAAPSTSDVHVTTTHVTKESTTADSPTSSPTGTGDPASTSAFSTTPHTPITLTDVTDEESTDDSVPTEVTSNATEEATTEYDRTVSVTTESLSDNSTTGTAPPRTLPPEVTEGAVIVELGVVYDEWDEDEFKAAIAITANVFCRDNETWDSCYISHDENATQVNVTSDDVIVYYSSSCADASSEYDCTNATNTVVVFYIEHPAQEGVLMDSESLLRMLAEYSEELEATLGYSIVSTKTVEMPPQEAGSEVLGWAIFLMCIGILGAGAAIGVGGWYYWKYRNTQLKTSPASGNSNASEEKPSNGKADDVETGSRPDNEDTTPQSTNETMGENQEAKELSFVTGEDVVIADETHQEAKV